MKNVDILCTLCGEGSCQLFLTHKKRDFYHCSHCDLVFVPASFHLSALAEKAEYRRHHNHEDHQGYRSFLNRVREPLLKLLTPGMEGLDFGSGPGPVLSQMLNESGFPCATYDPFYAPFESLLKKQYDFVTCTEVVEHFSNPLSSWQELLQVVKPDGILAVMTLLRDSTTDFSTWWYKNDPTHVAFYSRKTMKWIAEKFGLRSLSLEDDRTFLFKTRRACSSQL